jgi:hypothetical protein
MEPSIDIPVIFSCLIVLYTIIRNHSAEIYLWYLEWDRKIESQIDHLEKLIKEDEENL